MEQVVRWQSQGGMMLEFENPLQAIERAQLIDDHAPLKLQNRKCKPCGIIAWLHLVNSHQRWYTWGPIYGSECL